MKKAWKKETFHNILTKRFSSDTPQGIKRQNVGIRVQKNTIENIYPVVDRKRPIRITQAHDRHSCPISSACL